MVGCNLVSVIGVWYQSGTLIVCGKDSLTLGVPTVYAGHNLAAGFRVALGADFPLNPFKMPSAQPICQVEV